MPKTFLLISLLLLALLALLVGGWYVFGNPMKTPDPETINAVTLPPGFGQPAASGGHYAPSSGLDDDETKGLKIGAPIPELKGAWLTPDGVAPDLNGKVLLIDFWTTVCGSCVEAIPHNNKLHADYSPKGLVLVAATPEKKALVEEFEKSFTIRYAVLADCNDLFKTCDITALPSLLLFGKDGKLSWKGDAFDARGNLNADFEKVLNAALK